MEAYKYHVSSQQFTMTDREINKTGRKQNCSTLKMSLILTSVH